MVWVATMNTFEKETITVFGIYYIKDTSKSCLRHLARNKGKHPCAEMYNTFFQGYICGITNIYYF